MAHQDITVESIDTAVIIEVPISSTPVVDQHGGQTRFVVNRLFICTGTVNIDFKAKGYTPDDGTLVFPIWDDDRSQLTLEPGDAVIRATVHASLGEIKNDGGDDFQFGVREAFLSDAPPISGRKGLFVQVEMDVAGGDDDNNGHIFRLSYNATLLAQIARPPRVKLPFETL